MTTPTNPSVELATTDGTDVSSNAAESRRGLADEFCEMFTEQIRYRELLGQMVLRDIRIRYKQAVMGFAWALFMPLAVVAAGSLVKYAMARLTGGEVEIAGMAVKALGWSFFVGAIGFSTNSLVGNMGLVTKIYFPREVFPFSAITTQIFDSSIGSTALALLLFTLFGVPLGWSVAWVIPLVLILIFMTAGMALMLSCANVFFRDVKYIVQVMITFGIFFTPVFFEPSMFGPRGGFAMMLNPLAPVLEGLRLSIVEGHNLLLPLAETLADGGEIIVWQPWYLAYSAVVTIVGFIGSWLIFHKLEFVFPEYV